MKYVSTRGKMPPQTFTETLVMGIAPDGGLAVPAVIPRVDSETLTRWAGLSYPDLAFEIFSLFIDDIPSKDLRTIVNQAYNADNFGDQAITPLRFLDEKTAILGLSNGPTLAFKDIAMQLIGHLFEYVLARNNQRLNIIGATSGDTGSAAEHAMLGKQRVNVFMLSPHGRMSPFQQAQMYGLDEPNIFNIAIKGVFDDCQDIVKAINADADFKEKYHIGAVNSINWARIMAQTVYYFKGYFATKAAGVDEPISFCVPSGNFGNVYAGFVAKRMGLPINKLIVATNENDVLHECLQTKQYRVRTAAQVLETSSPSMDIGKASNFERYVYHMLGDDAGELAAHWAVLASTGVLDLSDLSASIEASGLVSGQSSHDNRLATIQSVYQQSNDYIDPHTADGVYVAKTLAAPGVTICLETALPAKFEDTMQAALGKIPPRPAGYEGIETKAKQVIVLENEVDAVKALVMNNA